MAQERRFLPSAMGKNQIKSIGCNGSQCLEAALDDFPSSMVDGILRH